jgi:hypothetical protein
MARSGAGSLILLVGLASLVAACKPDNKFVAPPPAEVAVALPLQQKVVPYRACGPS